MGKLIHKELAGRLAWLCLVAALSASGAPADPAAADGAAANASFAEESARRARDPFWPFGYMKKSAAVSAFHNTGRGIEAAKAQPMPTPDDWADAQKKLKIDGSIRLNRQLFVLVNNKMCGPGDVLGVRHGDFIYRFRVKSVDEKNVRFEKVNRTSLAKPEEKTGAP